MSNRPSQFLYEGNHNSFKFVPDPSHEDAAMLSKWAKELGYQLLFSPADYALEDVQKILREKGASVFLSDSYLAHEISSKAALPDVEALIARRLDYLAPEAELLVIDPFLFPSNPRLGVRAYAASATRVIAPLLERGASLTVITHKIDASTRGAVEQALIAACPSLSISVTTSDAFHDRFWIADRARGVVVGTSLNGIGSRIFLIDSLSDVDVAAVVAELAPLGI